MATNESNIYEEFSDTTKYPVEISDLLNWVVAKIPAEWENVGTLLNIEDGKLKAIRMNTSLGGEPKNFFRETLSLWKRGNYKPYNWSTLLNILCSPIIDNKPLADEIAEKLRQKKKVTPSVTSTKETSSVSVAVEEERGLTAQYAVQVLRECEFRMFSNWSRVATTLGVILDERRRLKEQGVISRNYDDVMEEALVLWIKGGNATWEKLIEAVEREEKNTAKRMRYLLQHNGLL